MKKLLTLVMTAVLGIACVFGMTACGKTKNGEKEQKTFTVLTNCPFAPFEYTEKRQNLRYRYGNRRRFCERE